MYDAIIIGAGMSGLAAGVRLAYYDRRVCMLERHTTIGGMNSFYRLRGRNYDVGLHAVTNYAPRGERRGPLPRVLRQLRLRWDQLELAPQRESLIDFPSARLRFSNDPALLEAEIERQFPERRGAYRRLLNRLIPYDELDHPDYGRSAREVLRETLGEPLLENMLLCPVMWYGNAREHDMEFGRFSMLFRSIFLEGLARPWGGVRVILKQLVRRYKELGGELRLRCGARRIVIEQGRAVGVELDDGRRLDARTILSSAGAVETFELCGRPAGVRPPPEGQLSFVETVSVLDRSPRRLGHPWTMVFFSEEDAFSWRRPAGRLCDLASGVICSPNNYDYDAQHGDLPEGWVRTTVLADPRAWADLDDTAYRREKLRWGDRILEAAVRHAVDFRWRIVDADMFTPRTIERFTGRRHGAVYGAPCKRMDGRTDIDGLYLCGTDQGFVGIIGAMIGGIAAANRHVLHS